MVWFLVTGVISPYNNYLNLLYTLDSVLLPYIKNSTSVFHTVANIKALTYHGDRNRISNIWFILWKGSDSHTFTLPHVFNLNIFKIPFILCYIFFWTWPHKKSIPLGIYGSIFLYTKTVLAKICQDRKQFFLCCDTSQNVTQEAIFHVFVVPMQMLQNILFIS